VGHGSRTVEIAPPPGISLMGNALLGLPSFTWYPLECLARMDSATCSTGMLWTPPDRTNGADLSLGQNDSSSS
jgi:hypothetical protein